MNKVTDYSVIIFRKDGTIDYETVHATDKCNYVLFLDKDVKTNVCNVDDLTDYDYATITAMLKSNMCIGSNNALLKCRWLHKPTLLMWINERGHYNFYLEDWHE